MDSKEPEYIIDSVDTGVEQNYETKAMLDPSLRYAAPGIAGATELASSFATGSPKARRRARIMMLVLIVPGVLVALVAIATALIT